MAGSAVVRAGLAALLSTPKIAVIGSSADGLPLADQDPLPDVVVWEEEEQAEEIVFENGAAWVLLTDEPQAWVEAGRSGVKAWLPREATAAEIIAAVEAAALGLLTIHPELLGGMLSTLAWDPEADLPERIPVADPGLTPREIEVLRMLAEGLGNKQIAKRLTISEHTVKFHVGSVLTKLKASSRTEAVTLGARQGLISL